MVYKIKIMGEIPPDAEGSSVQARFAPEAAEDVEGQGFRFHPRPDEGEDAEGNMPVKWHLGQDEGGEEAAGNVPVKWHLSPDDGKEAEGNTLRSHLLEIERDAEGELVGRFVPADENDDTEGNSIRRY